MNRLSPMDRVRQEIALQLARLRVAQNRAWRLRWIIIESWDRCRSLLENQGPIPQSIHAEIAATAEAALEAARRCNAAYIRIHNLAEVMGVTSATPEARP